MIKDKLKDETSTAKELVILGAGPAGLSCAYEFMKHERNCRVWDKNDVVGGLARTINYKGYRFDVGPHRFFTKNDEVNKMWHEILGEDTLQVKRLTRILYNNRFFNYPLKPFDALFGLGVFVSTRALLSFIWAKWRFSGRGSQNFEEWVVKHFGEVLYKIFFKTYTEKVWGLPCTAIGAEWAAQRIKGLSLSTIIVGALFGQRKGKAQIKTLVDRFDYPKTGAGLVYEKMAKSLIDFGTTIELNTAATVLHRKGSRISSIEGKGREGLKVAEVEHLFSSIPLTEFVMRLMPPAPDDILEAARALYYRDHITVNLILNRRAVFPDNWIYVHSPEVRMSRITDYGNFSEAMLADKSRTCIAVEYFVFAYEEIWASPDKDIIGLAISELNRVGLVRPHEVMDGFVVREKDSYPVYYVGHRPLFDRIKAYVETLENVTLIGRGGMYKYNNQDHSILTGLLAARKYFGQIHDLWEVNTDGEYLEEKQLPSPIHADNPHITGNK